MMIKRHFLPLAALLALFAIAASQLHAQAPGYHVVATYKLGGGGSWDYLAFDGQGHRVFIGRQDRVMVVDAPTGKLLGEVPGLKSAHGAALSEANNRGFATEGAGFVTMFDLKTLKVVGRTPAAEDADAILFDPFSKHIFTMNGDSNSASVIDPTGKNIGTIVAGPPRSVHTGNGCSGLTTPNSSHMLTR